MRIIYSVIFIVLLFAVAVPAQTPAPSPAPEKPLTQAEYVQLLYTLERSPAKHDEIVETVRKRGIGFVLTDGLKSLTASKSGNDVTLRRTLEEAARRKDNPVAFQLPSEKESSNVLTKAGEIVGKTSEEMPDFLVKQVIQRSVAYAGTNKFQPLDRLLIAVGYRATGREEYRLLSVNGIPQKDPTDTAAYMEMGGATSTGEFVNELKLLFDEETQTKFEPIDTDVIRGRRTIVFSLITAQENSKGALIYTGGAGEKAVRVGYKGKVWIDRENFRILRIQTQTTDIPTGFPITASSSTIDYDWVVINNQKYLLPWSSEMRMTTRERGPDLIERRNEIRFRNYQKYDVDIKVLDDDTPIEEETPATTPPPAKKP